MGFFRVVSFIEGLSYVVLLGVAMPLKYLAGHAEAVTHAGRIHGGLFVLFVIALVATRWPRPAQTTAFIAGLIPFGAFWLEHRIRAGKFPP